MEKFNIPHEVSTYISHDSPHLGANVPLGALYMVNQVISCLHGFGTLVNIANLIFNGILSEFETAIYNTLNSTAARQMLFNYVTPSGEINNFVHEEWLTELRGMGFPEGDEGEGIANLCIVNGGAYNYISDTENGHLLKIEGNANTSLFSNYLLNLGSIFSVYLSGSDIFQLPILGDILRANIVPGSNQIYADVEVNPLISSNVNSILSRLYISYTKKFLWLIPKTYEIFSSNFYAPLTNFSYDTYPGSSYPILFQLNGEQENFWGGYNLSSNHIPSRIMFIPVASALAIKSINLTESHFTLDYFTSNPEPTVETPFDSYYLCDSITPHIDLEEEMLSWIYEHISTNISGPDYITEQTTYSIPGHIGTLKWSSSNETVAIVNNAGQVTPTGDGNVTITAESYSNGKYYRKTKGIAVNFPDIYISFTFVPGVGFKFTAESTNAQATALLNNLVEAGTLQYEWSLIDGDDNMQTQTVANNFMTYLPQDSEVITIAVRLVDTAGNKGATKSYTINLSMPFATTYKYTIVTSNQTVYYVKANGTYEVNNPSSDFGVRYLSTGYDPDDNIMYTQGMVNKYLKGNNCYISFPGPFGKSYWTGVKNNFSYMWTFEFFDTPLYYNALDSALACPCDEEHIMESFDLIICNSLYEDMQRVPFAIICKPNFPEN